MLRQGILILVCMEQAYKRETMGTTLHREQTDFFAVLHGITLDLFNHRTNEPLLRDIVDTAAFVLQAPSCALLLYTDDALFVKAVTGDLPDVLGTSITREDAALAWQAFEMRQPAVVEDYASWSRRPTDHDVSRIRAAAAIPIMVEDICIGVLTLSRHKPGFVFTVKDVDRAELFSRVIAIVLENSRLYDEALHEIERRKQSEAALRDSEQRQRIITEGMRDMVVFVAPDSSLLYANTAYMRTLGYKPEDVLGEPALNHIHPDDLHRIALVFQYAVANRANIPLTEYRCRHANGSAVWVEAVGTVIFDDDGQLQGLVAVCREISERYELEQLRVQEARLQVALQKEKELSDLKSRMMTRITHEFRTPLTILQMSSDILERHVDQMTPDQVVRRTSIIRDQIHEISGMLDLISSGVNGSFMPQTFMPGELLLLDLCYSLINELQTRYATTIDKHFDLNDSFIMRGDSKGLRRALTNVLVNALTFSPKSSPIRFELYREPDGVVMSVRDEGIGILPEELPRVFDPFFRGSNIGETRGLGLGLTVARAVADAHRGTIVVESQPDQGTRVTIRLPL